MDFLVPVTCQFLAADPDLITRTQDRVPHFHRAPEDGGQERLVHRVCEKPARSPSPRTVTLCSGSRFRTRPLPGSQPGGSVCGLQVTGANLAGIGWTVGVLVLFGTGAWLVAAKRCRIQEQPVWADVVDAAKQE